MKCGLLYIALTAVFTAKTLAVPALKSNQVSLALNLDDPANVTPLNGTLQDVTLLFNGADSAAGFSRTEKVDQSTFNITNPLSVTSVTLFGYATCVLNGQDGGTTVVTSYGVPNVNVPVGPPQTQLSGSCYDPRRVSLTVARR